MTRRTFANELEQAADAIADVSRADLQILLRRAALRLRNTEGLALDSEVDEAVDFLAAEMNLPRSEVLQTIVSDWLSSWRPAASRHSRRGERDGWDGVGCSKGVRTR